MVENPKECNGQDIRPRPWPPGGAKPRSSSAPSRGQGRFSGHLSRPPSPPRPEGTARPLARKREPANTAAAAAQYASAGAPDKGRSQFRRESRARLNPREAGLEPGKGRFSGRCGLSLAGLQISKLARNRRRKKTGARSVPITDFQAEVGAVPKT